MTWKPALPRYSLSIPARRKSSSIKRTRLSKDAVNPCPSTAMPARPRTTECDPVCHLPALFGIEHVDRIRQCLCDALARRFRKHDLLRAQPLDCSMIDGGSGQKRDRLGPRSLRLLPQRPQIADGSLGNVRDLDLLVRCGVELDRHMLGHAVDAIVDLRRRERTAEHATIAHSEVMPSETHRKQSARYGLKCDVTSSARRPPVLREKRALIVFRAIAPEV